MATPKVVLPVLPVGYFGMAVGTLALGQTWRVAERLWQVPVQVALLFSLSGLLLWGALLLAYGHKWWRHAALARQELSHPLHSGLAALGAIATMLAALTLARWSRQLAQCLLVPGLIWQTVVGLASYGRFWQGGRTAESVTAAVYLPAVAQNLVAGMVCSAVGWTSLGMLYFGAGFFSWLALESMIISRAALHAPIERSERPLLGIQMAPAVVAGLAYTSLPTGVAELPAQMLLGYGLYQQILLWRLLPWIFQHPFAPSYWSFSFGMAAIANLSLRLYERSPSALLGVLATLLLALATLVIAALLVATAVWAWRHMSLDSR